MDKETSQNIQELQIIEYHLNSILVQKQSIQMELEETTIALEEVNKSEENVYKVLSGFMLKVDKNKVREELEEKKKILQLRDSSLEKQEKLLLSKIEDLKSRAQKSN